jgi:hypothetical protein
MRSSRHLATATLAIVVAFLVLHTPSADAEAGAAGETTDVQFFGHVFGHGADAPMPANVEYPVGESNYGLGTFHWCTSQGEYVLDPEGTPNTERNCENSYVNSLALFSTAGFVDVGDREEFVNNGAYSQLHNERGQVKPILLDTSKKITSSIKMTVDAHAWLVANAETDCPAPHPEDSACAYPYWGWDVAAQPDYQVKATLYAAQLGQYKGEAARQPPIEETLRNGDPTVVAQGQTEPALVANGVPSTPKVLDFEIDMGTPQVSKIPKTHDFFTVYKFYSNSSGERYSAHTWRIWSGEFFPPTWNMPTRNAFAVESVIPSFVHGKLAILGVMSSPWGSYDINPDATTLTIENKQTGEVVTPESIEVFSDSSVAHGGHFDPANVTYIWDYKKDGLAPGEYEVTITAQNYQGSRTASCTGNFTVRANGQPGPTDVGQCGFQSLTEEERRQLEEGADEQAEEGSRMSQPDPLPEVAGSTLAGLAALAAIPRRYRP